MGILLPTVLKNAEWHPTKSVTVNRTTGVAPLTIFFDAEALGEDYSDDPFHEIEYRWDFGDTANSTATWDYGSNAGVNLKNETTGPVAAHVYEEPGTYSVEVTVWDGSESSVYTVLTSITVTDPETVFADTTYVVSGLGDFTDAPSGATELTSSDFDSAMTTALAAGAKRVLFKAGETFDFGSTTTISDEGPYLIGSFGEGDRPILNATTTSIYGISMSGAAEDIRFMDFQVNGNSFDTPVRATSFSGTNILIFRVYGYDLGYLAAVGGTNVAIVECSCYNIVGGNGNMLYT